MLIDPVGPLSRRHGASSDCGWRRRRRRRHLQMYRISSRLQLTRSDPPALVLGCGLTIHRVKDQPQKTKCDTRCTFNYNKVIKPQTITEFKLDQNSVVEPSECESSTSPVSEVAHHYCFMHLHYLNMELTTQDL